MGRPLEDNVAVVMGAGAGYGRAVAIALGQAGAIVLAADRDPELAEDTAATVRELGGSGEGFADAARGAARALRDEINLYR
ncbi:MAG TPA: SDR family NAD(P)-dependent oxidoreductase [Tepidiformaceae bacterium]|nr:SDR family NAD(P)-dependent oxidoreductase [Tepidiformaceae bacterium]